MTLSRQSFEAVASLFQRVSGICLTEAKRPLVIGRLQKLAQERGIPNLDDYVRVLTEGRDADELQRAVDRLTTNETYFFREPQHFEFLAGHIGAKSAARGVRVWSAASSSGEEAFSIAMVLADRLGTAPSDRWEVVGTDLSTAMVASARRALYPLERARDLPPEYLRRFCLKGHGPYEGYLRVGPQLRQRATFLSANLMQPLPQIGRFDLIFLRNVLIYFDPPAKAQIVRRVLERLEPGGLLLTGHAESLANLDLGLRTVRPAVYAPV